MCGSSFRITKRLTQYPTVGDMRSMVFPCYLLVISDYGQLAGLEGLTVNGEPMVPFYYYYAFDNGGDEAQTASLYITAYTALRDTFLTVTVIALVLYGLFYAAIYKIAARAYYSIVANKAR